MITEIVSILAGVQERFRRDDDTIDRFHHRYTTILLVVFAVVSTTQQLVGDTIHCWAPKEFEDSWINYVNQYCWVKNTYFLPFEEHIPKKHEPRDEIVYYQWIPFIFLGMAIFFFLPSLVWNTLNSKSGVDSDNILETAENFKRTEKLESKEKHLTLITNQLNRFVGSSPKTVGGMTVKKKSSFIRNLFCLCGKKFGNYLVILYIITKTLYIVNVFAQLFLLNSILETDFNIFGVQVIRNMWDDTDFMNHTIFPKVTMCDFEVRGLAHEARRYTVQCLLPINLYTEKMFVFLWFWMVLLLFLTSCSLLSWILHSILPNDRNGYIRKCLILMDRVDPNNKKEKALCSHFVNNYLRLDGVFVLRMIGHNTNSLTASEIIASLWDSWRDRINDNKKKPRGLDEPDLSNADTMPLKSMPPSTPLKGNYRPDGVPPPPPLKPPYPSGGAKGFPSPPVMPTAPMNNYA